MDISDLLKNLNDKQQKAVIAPHGNLLVLAGAGSGKTRVLVHRIAWLLSVKHFPPHSIMAVTFTNKAALEIRNRIQNLLGTNQKGMWIGTFHSLAYRLLQNHHMEAQLPKEFQILNNEDQLRLLKGLIRTLNIDEKECSSHQAIWYIGAKKNAGLRPQYVKDVNNPLETTCLRIYQAYQEVCERAGLVDFSELLLRTHEFLLKKPHILLHYRTRFSNILIDEFQDTNQIQYAWIHILAGNQNSVTIVGDDDQSIYGWRGAQVTNIQRFLDDFPDAKIIRLEQNYRSTKNILKAANALIAHNDKRLGKHLWSTGVDGEPITFYCAFNELDEAQFVVNRIKINQNKGGSLKDCAILYRRNAQSRMLEEALLQNNLPYHIYGGIRFFERQEIKNAIAYLRLIANRNDETAYEQIINTPIRGIGYRTLDIIRNTARDLKLTFWHAGLLLLQKQMLPGRSASALQGFTKLINTLEEDIIGLSLHEKTDYVIKNSGLWRMYKKENSEKYQTRIENLQELINATRQYHHTNNEDQDFLPMQSFLSHIALEGGEGQANAHQDAVQLMTLHSAKGLEFQQVFIVGMEEGIFPSKMSLNKRGQLEEERRLAYVGVTRAIQKLTISYSEIRRLYGKEEFHRPSRFLYELPKECIEEIHLRKNVIHPNHQQLNATCSNKNDSEFKIGQKVRHPRFGRGRIINLEGIGKHGRLQITFQEHGIKWLMVAYARLEII